MKLPTFREISSSAFGVNLFLANLMRLPVLSVILRIPVGILWLIGFSTWYLGSLIEGKPHPHKTQGWYTFAEFKVQNEIAALVGTIAAIIFLVAPELIVPIAWLFLISNVFWSIAAHHESQVPHTDDDYSTDKQIVYSYLTYAATSLSLVTAIGATLSVLFPFMMPVLVPLLTCVGIGLTCVSIGLGLKWYFGTYETDKAKRERLHPKNDDPEATPDSNVPSPPAHFSNPIFSSEISSAPDPKPSEDQELAIQNNCEYSSPLI